MAMACTTDLEILEDKRGFTTAGDDYSFNPKSPERRNKSPGKRRWTFGNGRRNRHLKALSMPVAPADLDLDATLRADRTRSFLSPVTSGDESSSSNSNSRSGSGSRRKKNRLNSTHGDDSESESVGSTVSLMQLDRSRVLAKLCVAGARIWQLGLWGGSARFVVLHGSVALSYSDSGESFMCEEV